VRGLLIADTTVGASSEDCSVLDLNCPHPQSAAAFNSELDCWTPIHEIFELASA